MKLTLISAPWCTPCKKYKPVLTKAAAEAGMDLEVLDAEADVQKVGALGITTVPTTILSDGDTELGRLEGAYPARKLQEWLSSAGGTTK